MGEPAAETPAVEDETSETEETTEVEEKPERASDGLKADLAKERRQRQAAQKELEKLRADAMSDQEKAVAAAKAEGMAEAKAEALTQTAAMQLEVAAAKLLTDPSDAAKFIDIGDLIDGDSIDGKAADKAVAALIKERPYLAAKTATPLPGDKNQPAGGKQNDMNALIRSAAGHT